MGIPFHQASPDVQIALTEFRSEFMLALMQGAVDAWADQLGTSVTSKSLRLRFPVPVSAAGYSEFVGDMKYRSLYQKHLEMLPKTWQDGIAELASVVESDEFIGWQQEPAAMAQAALSLPNDLVVALLEAGASTTCWDGDFFFGNAHPVNVFDTGAGTFDNLETGGGSAFSLANVKIADKKFRERVGPNGKNLGLRMTHCLVPPALAWEAKDVFANSQTVLVVGSDFAAADNLMRGYAQVVEANELTSTTAWYPLALNKPGLRPWIVQTDGAPETIILDRSSHLYQSQLKVGMSSIRRANAQLAMPVCIQRWAGA